MSSEDRRNFLSTYWPGLSLLVLVYVALTIVRTVRDDFAVEIWRDMGVNQTPSVFTRSEIWVGIVVTTFSGLTIWVKNNWLAIRLTIGLMSASFVLVMLASIMQSLGNLSPFVFMVSCGVGLYIPYVAFHTTVFERLIAVSRLPSNLGFLMYIADSIGYLGYAIIIVVRTQLDEPHSLLPFFRWTLIAAATLSILCLIFAWMYFHRKLAGVVEQTACSPAPENVSTLICEK